MHFWFLCINMTMSGCPSAAIWPGRRCCAGAGACAALPHCGDGSSSWADLQRCPVGAAEISAGADSARAGGSSKRRRRHEREKWGGNGFGPFLFPLVSVISFQRRGSNFLLLSVSFCLKMGFHLVGRWEKARESKRTRDRISAPIYLHQISVWAISQSIPFYF